MDRSASEDGYAIGGGEKVSSMSSMTSMTKMTRSSRNFEEKNVKSANLEEMANPLQNFCQAKLTIRGISLCNIFHRCEYVYIA